LESLSQVDLDFLSRIGQGEGKASRTYRQAISMEMFLGIAGRSKNIRACGISSWPKAAKLDRERGLLCFFGTGASNL
jgi:hypothetical protein